MSNGRGDGVNDEPPPETVAALLEVAKWERDAQQSRADALDGKAGVAVGFAGALVALSAGPPSNAWIVAGRVVAVASVVIALGAFVPFAYKEPALRLPALVDRYQGLMVDAANRRLLDLLTGVVDQARRRLRRKAWALNIAAIAFGIAVVLLLVGTVPATTERTPDARPEATATPAG